MTVCDQCGHRWSPQSASSAGVGLVESPRIGRWTAGLHMPAWRSVSLSTAAAWLVDGWIADVFSEHSTVTLGDVDERWADWASNGFRV